MAGELSTEAAHGHQRQEDEGAGDHGDVQAEHGEQQHGLGGGATGAVEREAPLGPQVPDEGDVGETEHEDRESEGGVGVTTVALVGGVDGPLHRDERHDQRDHAHVPGRQGDDGAGGEPCVVQLEVLHTHREVDGEQAGEGDDGTGGGERGTDEQHSWPARRCTRRVVEVERHHLGARCRGGGGGRHQESASPA